MKLPLLLATLLIAALAYGGKPLSTDEFLNLDRSVALRLLQEAVQDTARRQGVAPSDQRVAALTAATFGCVRDRAADHGDVSAAEAISVCLRTGR